MYRNNFLMLIAAFKKEFEKLGGSITALAKSFEYDERPGMYFYFVMLTIFEPVLFMIVEMMLSV